LYIYKFTCHCHSLDCSFVEYDFDIFWHETPIAHTTQQMHCNAECHIQMDFVAQKGLKISWKLWN